MKIKQQSSNEYGISQELLVLSHLSNYGVISIPYGNSARYDCILDVNGRFLKIQIKSLNKLDEDKINIPMRNSRLCSNGSVTKCYTKVEVDYIAISYNNWVYLFEPELANVYYTVTVSKPEYYNQHWIEDYRIDKVLDIQLKSWETLKEETREKEKMGRHKYKCIDCGKPVWNKDTRCVCCARVIKSQNSSKPSREELKSKIKNTPFTQIGKEYNVTDNAVRKWCESYNLPFSSKDIKEIVAKGEWDLI